jgi:protein phosphatase
MSESLTNWDNYLAVASLSDVGMRRSNNQDNMSISMAGSMEQWQRKGHVFVVADGMGAHAAGELASKLAIEHVPHLYSKYNDASPPEELRKSVVGANAEIYRRGQANEEFYNMGTTCCAMTLLPQGAVIAHIGDSRVYRLSKNRLEQLTFDHSLVWEMKAAGQLTAAEEKSGKIPKNVITRSLGPYPDCKVDLEGPFPLTPNDTFLMCSDGLTGVISDPEIASILANMTPDEAVRVLVDLANLRGGPDNITVIVAKVIHPKLATSPDAPPLVINSKKSNYEIPLFVWALFGASLLFALIFLFWDNAVTAALPGLLAIGTGIYILTQLIRSWSSGHKMTTTQRFGKAPYTRVNCASQPQFAKQLAAIWNQLENAAKGNKWNVDQAQLDSMSKEAKQHTSKSDFSSAIRSYGRAISQLMESLRNHVDGSSSSLDL